MRKWTTTAAALLAASVMLAACGGNNSKNGSTDDASATPEAPSPTASTSNEVVTLRTNMTEDELSKDQIAEFESEHPNIKIQLENVDGTKMAALLATGDAPDIIRMSGVWDVPNYVLKGIAMDLTDRIAGSTVIRQDDLLPIADVFRFDGKEVGKGPIYGLPKDWSNDYAIFYNKKAFEAAGVPVPDSKTPLTWPQVMDLARQLTIKDGKTIKQYGLAANEWGKSEPNFNNMLQYLLSAGIDPDASDMKSVNFDQPAVKDYINMWVQAVKDNVGPNSLNNDQTSGGDLFKQNKVAMIIDGYWFSGVLRAAEETKSHLDDFGMLPAPTAPNGERVSPTGSASGGIIYNNTKYPDAAWTFFEWYFGGKPADDRAKTGWGLPAFKSKLALLPQETAFDKQVYDVLQEEQQYAGSYLKINPYINGGGWAVFEKYVTPLYFGKSSIDDAVKGITKDLNVTIQETLQAQ